MEKHSMRLFTIGIVCFLLSSVALGLTPEVKIPFKVRNGLIVAPFLVNDTKLDLIVDSGSPSTILFHNRSSVLNIIGRTKHYASGYGNIGGSSAEVSLNNYVSFNELYLENIAILLVDGQQISTGLIADGIIGYELFMKFEVEIDFASRVLIIRSPLKNHSHDGFSLLPLEIRGSKAYFEVETLRRKSRISRTVLLDTGSPLGLLLNETRLYNENENGKMYWGLSGQFFASQLMSVKVQAGNFRIDRIPLTIRKGNDGYGTIGLAFFKKCRVIINYPCGYIGLAQFDG